jgi:Mrp family chromosome partitioning ATPase
LPNFPHQGTANTLRSSSAPKPFGQRRPLALGLAAVTAALSAGALWYLLPQRYSATVSVHVIPSAPTSDPQSLAATVRAQLTSRAVLARALAQEGANRLALAREQPDLDHAAAALQQRIQVQPAEEPGVVRVALDGDDRDGLLLVLRSLVDVYLDEQFGAAARARGGLEFVEAEQAQIQARLQAARARRAEVVRAHTVPDREGLVRRREQLTTHLVRFQDQLRQMQHDLEGAGPADQPYRTFKKTTGSAPERGEPPASDGTAPLKSFVQHLQDRIASLGRETSALEQALAEDERLAQEIRRHEQELTGLRRQVGQRRAEAAACPTVRLHEPPQCRRVLDTRGLLALAGVPLVGLCLAGLAFVRGEGRRRFWRGSADLAAAGEVPTVGTLPWLRHPEGERYYGVREPQDVAGPEFVAAIDALCEGLRPAGPDESRLVLITSAGSGEGKSTLARHVALRLAQSGHKTLLVDADLRRPSAHRALEQTLRPGLCDVLLGQADLGDAVRPTTTAERLWLLPAGQWQPSVKAAFARADLGGLLEALRDQFAVVVVDASSVFAGSDVLRLGVHADLAFLSVLDGVSQNAQVAAATLRLRIAGVPLAGQVWQGLAGGGEGTRGRDKAAATGAGAQYVC